jgi:hypothetical protein
MVHIKMEVSPRSSNHSATAAVAATSSAVSSSPRSKHCRECGKLVVNMNEHIR